MHFVPTRGIKTCGDEYVPISNTAEQKHRSVGTESWENGKYFLEDVLRLDFHCSSQACLIIGKEDRLNLLFIPF